MLRCLHRGFTCSITLACKVLEVKHVTADTRVVCYAKSKNHTHFVKLGQVFELQGTKRIFSTVND